MVFKSIDLAFFKFGLLTFIVISFQNSIQAVSDASHLHFPKEHFAKNDERLLAADEYLAADLAERAIELYRNILEDGLDPKNLGVASDPMSLQTSIQSRFHLAQAYATLKNFQAAIPLLQDNINATCPLSSELETLRNNSIYLLGLIYKETGLVDESLKMMNRYLMQGSRPPLYNEALFEIAHIYFMQGDMEHAAVKLESLQAEPASKLAHLRSLYRARIQIAQGNFSAAIKSLEELLNKVGLEDDFHYELEYVMGEAYFGMHAFSEAIEHFKHALPEHHPDSYRWYGETLYYLGWSYLNLADVPSDHVEEQLSNFSRAESSFLTLLAHQPEEKGYLSLGQYYLARAKRLQEAAAYSKAEEILSQKKHFKTIEAQTHALLLRAEAAPRYLLRKELYQQITHPENSDSSFYGKGWFLSALNDFDEGERLAKAGNSIGAKEMFAKSAPAFKQAFFLLKERDKARAAEALKYQALALSQIDMKSNKLAFDVIDELIQLYPDLLAALEHPDEIYYLRGFFGLKLATAQSDAKYASIAEQSLSHAASMNNSKFGDVALNQLAGWLYRNGSYDESEKVYLQLIEKFPASSHASEAWLWCACCADKLQKGNDLAKQCRRNVFEHFPQSSSAPEAYFTLYTYRDYLQGDREALKHLQLFAKQYPDSHFLIQAYYLLGLDAKRNRKTIEGKWIRKKSLTDAIDAFQKAESLFNDLAKKASIPDHMLDFYTNVYYRVILERALANLAIAAESQGAKQQIYSEYAEEVFKELLASFDLQQSEPIKRLAATENFFPLYEESAFGLIQAYTKRHKDAEAEGLIAAMLDRYQQIKVSRGYYLSRIHYEQGKIAYRQNNHLKALQHFKASEEAGKGNVLATNEKLDLWIQESHCYRDLQQYDDAILILSKVANDDAISSLRLKAMFLRADIYELQGRPELARKQLESLTKKGGDWALKAKEKLETNYGY